MKCRIREEDLALYLGGDLDAKRDAELRSHLEECVGCRQRASDLKWTAQSVATPFGPPLEEDLQQMREGITAGLRFQRQRNRRQWPWWSTAAAALLVTGLVVPALVRRGGERPVQEQAVSQQAALVVLPTATLTLPNLQLRRVPHRDRRPVVEAGLRGVSMIANSSGNAALRLTTADPDVVILLPMDGGTNVE